MISARSVFVACSHGSQELGVDRSENFVLTEVAKRVLGKILIELAKGSQHKKHKHDNYTEVLKLAFLLGLLTRSFLCTVIKTPHPSTHTHTLQTKGARGSDTINPKTTF